MPSVWYAMRDSLASKGKSVNSLMVPHWQKIRRKGATENAMNKEFYKSYKDVKLYECVEHMNNLHRSKAAPLRNKPMAGVPILNGKPRCAAILGPHEPFFPHLQTSTSNFWLSGQARPWASETFTASLYMPGHKASRAWKLTVVPTNKRELYSSNSYTLHLSGSCVF